MNRPKTTPLPLPAFLLAVVAGCAGRHASPPSTPAAAAHARQETAYVFVSNERSNDISVINASTRQVVRTIPVGKRPRGMRLGRDGRTLYVALSGSPIGGPGVRDEDLPPADKKADGIGLIDVATGRFIGKLASGSDPESFALSADERTAYVANEDADAASVVDLRSGAVSKTLKVGREPEGVATTPDGSRVYVTGETSNTVHVIDASSNAVIAQFKTAPRPRAVAFAPDGRTAYVTCENAGTVDVVDVATNAVRKSIPLRAGPADALVRPMGVAVAPDGARVYVTTGRGKSVVVIDASTDAVVQTVPDVGERPWGIALSPDGKTLYTANGPSNDVSVIDVAAMKVVAKVRVGTSPWGVVVSEPVSD